MKGVVHETNLERTLREMRETTGQLAHILDDQIMVVTDTEINEVLGVAEDDPKTIGKQQKHMMLLNGKRVMMMNCNPWIITRSGNSYPVQKSLPVTVS